MKNRSADQNRVVSISSHTSEAIVIRDSRGHIFCHSSHKPARKPHVEYRICEGRGERSPIHLLCLIVFTVSIEGCTVGFLTSHGPEMVSLKKSYFKSQSISPRAARCLDAFSSRRKRFHASQDTTTTVPYYTVLAVRDAVLHFPNLPIQYFLAAIQDERLRHGGLMTMEQYLHEECVCYRRISSIARPMPKNSSPRCPAS